MSPATPSAAPDADLADRALQLVTAVRKRVLDPVDRFSEIIFGLVMVLTFTGTIRVAESGREEVRELLLAALGCSLAWGIVDAVMYAITTPDSTLAVPFAMSRTSAGSYPGASPSSGSWRLRGESPGNSRERTSRAASTRRLPPGPEVQRPRTRTCATS